MQETNYPKDFTDNMEIMDVENYRGDKFNVFNHQVLVMEVLRRLNESGAHEFRPGWFNEKIDRNGNTIRVYIEDTRKKYIECVKTALDVMYCDFDKIAKKNINIYLKNLEIKKERLLESQWNWYQKLNPEEKEYWSGKIIKGFFNIEIGWYLKFTELEVECYRKIARELHMLTKRLDWYHEEEIEG